MNNNDQLINMYEDLKKKTNVVNQLKNVTYQEDVIHDAFIAFNTDNKLSPIMQKLFQHDELSFQHNFHTFYLWGGLAPHIFSTDYYSYLRPAWTHDIGKLKVSKKILAKPAKLNYKEAAKVKTHTTEGAKILSKIGYHLEAYFACEHHSNSHNNNLLTEEIKLFMVLDQLSAITIPRPYRDPLTIREGLHELKTNKRNADVLDQALVKEVEKIIS